MKHKRLVIAIDGYSSCGKSTMAKALAKVLNYTFIDSGAMYRGVALFALENGMILNGNPDKESIIDSLDDISLTFETIEGKQHLLLNSRDVEDEIRTPAVAEVVSDIAAISEVRQKLVREQRKMGEIGGIVMDGRDIGSVVFPNADLKFFVTAKPEIRAQRRFLELENKGIQTNLKEVLHNLETRDRIDSTRSDSPLIRTKDAILIDTSFLTPHQQLNKVLEKKKKK
ncbi:MAG: (d)CMP kinase, partial [Bacteroidetes bacterium]